MLYNGYHFLGMHLVWWLVWSLLLFWVFATPYAIPGLRTKKGSAIDILQKRLAMGEISLDEFQERSKLLAEEKSKWGI